MRRYTVLIIDDERLARETIRTLLQQRNEWDLVGEAGDGLQGIRLTDLLKPDLIFLDIDMPKVDGVKMIKQLSHRPHIVFSTAYDRYAIKAFEENAIDYLLKPYTDKRFFEALDRVATRIDEHQSLEKVTTILTLLDKNNTIATSQKRISVNANDKIIPLRVGEILWVKAAGNYVELHTATEKYLHYVSMSGIEELLGTKSFSRIHRSYLIRNDQVVSLRKHKNGEYFVLLKDGNELKLSRSYRAQVKTLIANLG